LTRQGVSAGDTVHIADHELVWGDQEELQPAAGTGRRRERG
jgi:hypothetical protein